MLIPKEKRSNTPQADSILNNFQDILISINLHPKGNNVSKHDSCTMSYDWAHSFAK